MTAATAPHAASTRDRTTAVSASAMVRETIAVAATLCGTVPAVLPLFERGMAHTHDGLIHVQRLIALESAMRQGAPLTRWLPDLAYGYGQPLLLYYAPSSYLPALAARFLGHGYAASVEIASGLALLCSALALYVLARSLFGLLAATVAAIVYAVLPYQLVDVYVRGALAESWAFVWLPLGAWCLTKGWMDRRARWSVGLAVSVAGLVLTHNVTALLFLPALVVLGVVLHLSAGRGWPGARSRWRDVPLRPVVGIALGLVLSAWFWVPALAERHLVQIGETIEPDLFVSFFVRGWPPFRLDPVYDYQLPVSTALGSPIFWPQLGLVQVCVTVVGAIAAIRTTGIVRGVAIWAVLLALGGYLMQLRPLAPLYDLIPLLTFAQFPWRLLAVIGLGSAILAGVLVETLSERAAIRAVFAVAIVALSLVTALAGLDPEPLPIDERMLSIETIARSELAEYGLGTTHSGEYLPVTSGQRNAARFRKSVIDAGGGQAGSSATAPSSLQVEEIDWRPDRVRAVVAAQSAERLVLHQFAFPGWDASVDGTPAAVAAVGSLGLIGVDVPAGRHTVEIAWTWTPLRLGSALVSLAAVPLLVLLAGLRRGMPAGRRLVSVVTVVACVALLVPTSWPPTTATALPSRSAPVWDIDDTLTLVGVEHDTSGLQASGIPPASDRVITSRLTWLVRQPPTTGYRAFLEVVARDGRVVHRAPWVYEPLSRLWGRGELVHTTIRTRLPDPWFSTRYGGLASDRDVSNWTDVRREAGERGLGLVLVFEQPAGIEPVLLGSIALQYEKVAGRPDTSEGVQIGTDVKLFSPTIPAIAPDGTIRVKPGGTLDVPLNWRQLGATPNVDRELLAVAVLVAARGEVVSDPRRPGDWFAPLPFWQRGDLIEQNIRLSLPGWLPPGSYPLLVRVFPRDLARSGLSEPGTSSARPRGRPLAELPLGNVTVEP